MMMQCGHSANGTTSNGDPCCVICFGFTDKAELVAEQPDLTGRIALCSPCKKPVPSSDKLPFFNYRPTVDTDSYYCGCRGWE